ALHLEVSDVCCVFLFSPPPLVFIGGSHHPFTREMSQTAIGDRPHLATCHLRGGGARGPPPLGRATWRSADRGLGPFGPVFGQMAARWAPMSCIWVRACLKSVWSLWWAIGSS